MIRTTTLPCGARIVTEIVESVHSAAIDLWIEVGSAFETAKSSGSSHLIEHMLFKGTKTRDGLDLVGEVEDAGGILAASTSRELTKLNCHLLGLDLPVALSAMLEMVTEPRFDKLDLELEKNVIAGEIDMYLDDPHDVAQELLYANFFKNSSYGRPITGSELSLSKIDRDDLVSYFEEHYLPERMIFSIAGNFDEERVIEIIAASLEKVKRTGKSAALPAEPAVLTPARVSNLRIIEDRDIEASELIVAVPGLKASDSSQPAMQMLDLAFATASTSRLFKEVREKRGLAYNVGALNHAYKRCGIYGVDATVGPERALVVSALISEEMHRLEEEGLTESEIKRARKQLTTDILIESESMTNRATDNAGDLFVRGKVLTHRERLDEIEAVSQSQIKDLAKKLFKDDPAMIVVGPQESLSLKARAKQNKYSN